MKKTIFLLFVAFAAQTSLAQSVFPTDGGSVGIGITDPTQKLDVNGNAIFRGSIISSMSDISTGGHIRLINPSKTSNGIANTWMIYNMASDFGNSIQFWAYDKLGCAGGGLCANRFTITDNGNVGIGTTNPASRLESINTIAGITSFKSIGTNGYLLIDNVGSGENYYSANKFQEFQINGVPKMRINSEGNIGIGTTNPLNKLDVNGTIHSKEVKVDMKDWSDFVFKRDYDLPTLEEVEKHITEKGHLENIPSEKEVLENGINLGEMNAKLLQKIEELTLYMIEIKKENTELKNRQQQFEKTILILINKM
ncbi:hypothetical protein [Flavobacterium sp. N1736]|uniref:hypothetical protein n=1 Tax=Flavobacterium sp. N1736 TaxID=2986823 RepID=UPI0022253383|nr:hypothetical protein [Flavobacterium sp. N1736]